MPQDFQPGEKVGAGRYVLERELGRGGMGVVWLAMDTELGESVALKFVPPEIRHDPMALDDMRRETLKSRRLTHPHIARIHDFCNVEGETPFITMEFMDGPNLSALQVEQKDRVFRWEQIQPWIAQLCSALQYAHEENVVHRDLKPGNLMLDSKGRIKLCDFGLAASLADSISRISRDMGSSGTPPYMSPQQLDGVAPSPADDIYSLGATLYELLTSKPPFHSGDIPHQIRSIAPLSIPDKLAELGVTNPAPEAAAALVLQCLVKNPVHRPASAAAVAATAADIGAPARETDERPEESQRQSTAGSPDDVAIPVAPDISGPEPSEPPDELRNRGRRSKILLWVFIIFVGLSALKKARRSRSGPQAETVSNAPSAGLAEGAITPLLADNNLNACDMIVLRRAPEGAVEVEVEWRKATPDNGIWSVNSDGVIQGHIEGAPDAIRKSYLVFDAGDFSDFELAFAFEFHEAPGDPAGINSGVFYRSGEQEGWFVSGISPVLWGNRGRVSPWIFSQSEAVEDVQDASARRDAFWTEVDPEFVERIHQTELFDPPASEAFVDAPHWWLIKARGDQLRHFLDGIPVSDGRVIDANSLRSGRIAIEVWAEPERSNTVEYEGFFLRPISGSAR